MPRIWTRKREETCRTLGGGGSNDSPGRKERGTEAPASKQNVSWNAWFGFMIASFLV